MRSLRQLALTFFILKVFGLVTFGWWWTLSPLLLIFTIHIVWALLLTFADDGRYV